MLIMKYYLNKTINVILLSIVMFFLAACFHDSDDSVVDLSDVTTEKAQEDMVKTVFNGFNASLENVDSVIFDSEALTALTENPQVTSLLGSESTTLQQSSSVMDFIDIPTLLGENFGDVDLLLPTEGMTDEQYVAQVDQLMATYFNEPVRVGNTISYTLNPDICSMNETATTEDIVECTDLLGVISIEQVLTSETSGTVGLLFNGSSPLTFGYSEAEIYVEADLGLTKTAIENLQPLINSDDELITLPDSMSGAVRLSFGTPTEDSTSIQLGVTKAIDIEGMFEDTMLDVSIAQSSDLLVFTADESTVNLGLDLKATSILMEDMSADVDDQAVIEIMIGGLMVNISSDDTGEIAIHDTGITDSLSVKIAETESALAAADPLLLVTLEEFDATIASDLSSIIFDTEFDVELRFNLLDQDLGLSISAESDTALSALTTQEGITPKVDAGSLTLSTISATEEMNVTAIEGECLGSSSDGFFEVVICPVEP